MIIQAGYDSPLGALTLTAESGVLTRLEWRRTAAMPGSDLLDAAIAQLAEYFDGKRQVFDLPFEFGTGLQADVRRAMIAIPFGRTRIYGDLAKDLGVPAQAIGQACGANALPILIPCHRILGSSGLGGYSGAGGVETKVALLRLEGAASLLI
jgi:methylated-DNA-[protein]-cysteine S-methyltransferase